MVKNGVVVTRSKRYYKPRPRINGVPLYPSIYDSCVFYFNYSLTGSATGGLNPTVFTEFYTSQPTANANFVGLSNYFGRYRVEKMTLVYSQVDTSYFRVTQLSLAPVHDNKIYAANYTACDMQKTVQMFNPATSPICRCIWKMDPSIAADVAFLDVPSVVTNPPVNYNGGILMHLQCPEVVPATLTNVYNINIKYKVRFQGRMARDI